MGEIQSGDVSAKWNIIVGNIYECSFMCFEEGYQGIRINWTKLNN